MSVNFDLSGGVQTNHLGSAVSASRLQETGVSERGIVKNAMDRDVVNISDMYRSYRELQSTQAANAKNGVWAVGESTTGSIAGATVQGLKKYLAGVGAGLDLTSMNFARQRLGRKIDEVIAGSGVKLGKNEKISISVDGDNRIKVGGLKDSKRAKAIEQALMEDEKLAQDIRRHYAQGKVNSDAKAMNDFAAGIANNPELASSVDPADLFTSRNLRSFIIDDYLRQNAGVGLSDLSSSDGVINGVNEDVAQLFTDDPELAFTVQNILDNGEQNLSFSVSLEFMNGAITDRATETAAEEKIKSIQSTVISLVDDYNKAVEDNSAGMTAEEVQAAKIGSVKIRADAAGNFELVNADELENGKKSAILNIVNKALEIYSKSGAVDPVTGLFTEGLDPYTNGKASGNFADIVETMVESHRLEDFDTEEYAHEVEIELNSLMSEAVVVSPEADKAREEMTNKVAAELGEDLRSLLEDNGVDVGNGIDVEVDADGRIKVQGDLANDPNLQAAQRVLDTFSQGALGGAGGPPASGRNPDADDRMDVLHGESRNASLDPAHRYRDMNNDRNRGNAWSPNVAKFEMPESEAFIDPEQPRIERLVESLANQYKNGTQTVTSHTGGSVSHVQAPRYMGLGGTLMGNADADADSLGIWDEHKLYGGDAVGKLQHIVDSLGRFHDGDRDRTIAFTIA